MNCKYTRKSPKEKICYFHSSSFLSFFVTTYSRWHSAMEHHRYHDLEGPEIHLRLVVLYHKRSCSTVVADNASNTTVFENPSKSYISITPFKNLSINCSVIRKLFLWAFVYHVLEHTKSTVLTFEKYSLAWILDNDLLFEFLDLIYEFK